MVLSWTPSDVIIERPSPSTAMPSSSVGPDVICSGWPLGKRWRHRWLCASVAAVKYIQEPSGDQPADRQAPSGPIGRGGDLASIEMSRHGAQPPLSFISTTKAQR